MFNYLKTIKDPRKKRFLKIALELGAKIEVLSKEFHLLRLIYKRKKKFLLGEKLYLNHPPTTLFAKNKEITKLLLQEMGLKVPLGIVGRNFKEALRRMAKRKISFPVVTKPLDATKGYGVTVGVKDKKELKKALRKVFEFCQKTKMNCSGAFLVEEMKKGKDFRILVLRNKVIACIERIPAYLIGDGRLTIKELILQFNKNRPEGFKLKVDKEIKEVLAKNHLGLNSILPKRQKIFLRKNANISSGGVALDKTKVISKRFKKIAIRCARALGLNFAGIDLLTRDISKENPRQNYFILEVNGAPDWEIHEKPLVQGEGVEVTKILVRDFFKN